jgi:hypothetical protein
MKSLNNSSSRRSESFTDEIKDLESLPYIDLFRPTYTSPTPLITKGDTILLIVPEHRIEETVSNIYTDLQNQIDSVYIVSDDEKSRIFNQKSNSKEPIIHLYQKITNHIFNINMIYEIINRISQYYSETKKRQLLILDCGIYNNGLLKSHAFMSMFANFRHIEATIVLIVRIPLGLPPELRMNFTHVLIDGSYTNSNMKRIWEHYLGMFPTYTYITKIQQEMSTDDIIHVLNNNSRPNTNRVKIYPMQSIENNIKFVPAVNTDISHQKNLEDKHDYNDILTRINKTIDELVEIRALIKSKHI